MSIDAKADLISSLERLNHALLAKLDGLGEYDLRRPMTPTGSNLLGIVKHLATVQVGYFGACFGRPWPEPLPWFGQASTINQTMYAAAEESSDLILEFFQKTWTHALETFAVTDLEDTGTVRWWPEDRRHPTLRTILVYMTVEVARHAGHVDIIRELIDGEVGRFDGDESVPGSDEIDWVKYVADVEAAARAASN